MNLCKLLGIKNQDKVLHHFQNFSTATKAARLKLNILLLFMTLTSDWIYYYDWR